MLRNMTRDDAVSLWVLACHDEHDHVNALGGAAMAHGAQVEWANMGDDLRSPYESPGASQRAGVAAFLIALAQRIAEARP